MSIAEVVQLLLRLGKIVGVNLLELATQVEPKLRATPLPPVDVEMDEARRAAIKRVTGGEEGDPP